MIYRFMCPFEINVLDEEGYDNDDTIAKDNDLYRPIIQAAEYQLSYDFISNGLEEYICDDLKEPFANVKSIVPHFTWYNDKPYICFDVNAELNLNKEFPKNQLYIEFIRRMTTELNGQISDGWGECLECHETAYNDSQYIIHPKDIDIVIINATTVKNDKLVKYAELSVDNAGDYVDNETIKNGFIMNNYSFTNFTDWLYDYYSDIKHKFKTPDMINVVKDMYKVSKRFIELTYDYMKHNNWLHDSDDEIIKTIIQAIEE